MHILRDVSFDMQGRIPVLEILEKVLDLDVKDGSV